MSDYQPVLTIPLNGGKQAVIPLGITAEDFDVIQKSLDLWRCKLVKDSFYTVKEAQLLRVCRICKQEDKPSPGNPLVTQFGDEYAHEQCLALAGIKRALETNEPAQ